MFGQVQSFRWQSLIVYTVYVISKICVFFIDSAALRMGKIFKKYVASNSKDIYWILKKK